MIKDKAIEALIKCYNIGTMKKDKKFWLMIGIILTLSVLVYLLFTFLLDDTECKDLEDIIEGKTTASTGKVGESKALYSSICE